MDKKTNCAESHFGLAGKHFMIRSFFLLLPLLFFCSKASAMELPVKDSSLAIILSDTLSAKIFAKAENAEQLIVLKPNDQKKKKLISAMLAFPFPFGFMGAHRVMLGCKPWVPVVYVATFGGCFGILPMIDFFVIVFSKDIEQYENNPHVFMWAK